MEDLMKYLESNQNDSHNILRRLLGNSTNSSNNDPIEEEWGLIGRSLVLLTAYGILIVIALFGNFLVCHVIFSQRRMRTVTNIFIANLAVSDLLLVSLNVPFNIAKTLTKEWIFGDGICRIMNMSLITSVYASTFTLTVIALDRQRVLLYPLRPRILKSGGMVVVSIIWLVSIAMSLPFGIYSKTNEVNVLDETVLRCRSDYPSDLFEQYLTIITIVLQYVLPLTVIAITYGRIVRKIWKRTDLGAVTAYQHACRSKHKKKSIKMLMIVVIVFAICWMPLNLYHVLTDLHPDTTTFRYSTTAFFVCHWIAISSTCYNPFIYCWLNEAFRAEIRAVFRCCLPMKSSTYTRDQKMDSVSQSDSVSLQLRTNIIFSKREPATAERILGSSLSHSCKTFSGCKSCDCVCRRGQVCICTCMSTQSWRSMHEGMRRECIDLLKGIPTDKESF